LNIISKGNIFKLFFYILTYGLKIYTFPRMASRPYVGYYYWLAYDQLIYAFQVVSVFH